VGLEAFHVARGANLHCHPGADVAVGPNRGAQIQAAIAGTTPGSEARGVRTNDTGGNLRATMEAVKAEDETASRKKKG
jgi:hypothetical protein